MGIRTLALILHSRQAYPLAPEKCCFSSTDMGSERLSVHSSERWKALSQNTKRASFAHIHARSFHKAQLIEFIRASLRKRPSHKFFQYLSMVSVPANTTVFPKREDRPAEISLLIFEDLNQSPPLSLPALRVVSRQWDAFITPLVFRHVKLTYAIVGCFGEQRIPQSSFREAFAAKIRAHTRGITIDRLLYWLLVVMLLKSLKGFKHLIWSVGAGDFIKNIVEVRDFELPYPLFMIEPRVL